MSPFTVCVIDTSRSASRVLTTERSFSDCSSAFMGLRIGYEVMVQGDVSARYAGYIAWMGRRVRVAEGVFFRGMNGSLGPKRKMGGR